MIASGVEMCKDRIVTKVEETVSSTVPLHVMNAYCPCSHNACPSPSEEGILATCLNFLLRRFQAKPLCIVHLHCIKSFARELRLVSLCLLVVRVHLALAVSTEVRTAQLAHV